MGDTARTTQHHLGDKMSVGSWGKSMKKYFIVVTVIVVIVFAGFTFWFLQNSRKPTVDVTQSIVVGVQPLVDASGLVYIADELNFFHGNGLNVTIKQYNTGLSAVDGTRVGENDIAVAAEFVLVENVLDHNNVTGFGSFSKSDTFEIIGRRDRGIENASDLRGKKIGVARRTISDFYLGRFLTLHGMNLTDVTLVNLSTPRFSDALDEGSVDAIISWGPYANAAIAQQGSNLVIMPAQSGQLTYWTGMGRSDWVAQHPDIINRFLKAIDGAMTYAINHPSESKAILEKRLNADDTFVNKVWNQTQFELSLDESQIMAMEDEGHWTMSNNLTSEKMNPNYRKYFYLNGLETVKLEAINIVH
jgi:NitT/TauT family transport system substrate-binding protein